MTLTIIAAVSENDVIGYRGKIPWKISEDTKRFRDMTMGNTVVMGRKTYESIPKKYRPLPGRENVVLSKSGFVSEGVSVYHGLDAALEECNKKGAEKVFIAGGEQVYKEAMTKADLIELTKVFKQK